jgi:phosphate transport system substrate-binding protein
MITVKRATVFIFTLIALATLFGCRPVFNKPETNTEGVFGECQIKGSDTLLMLSQRWAEDFMAENPDAIIQVTGGGSGVGIAALIDGTTDVANSSRPIKDKEIDNANAKGVEPLEFAVAMDGIAVIINPDNAVKELTLAQIKGIYTGEIKNWKDVGGADITIITYGRQSSSGTYVYFKEHVLEDEDYRTDNQELSGNSLLCDGVSKDKASIAYVGVGYASKRDDIVIIGVKADDASDPIVPSIETVSNGEYPISRYLYNYTNGTPEGAAKAYLAYALSDDGQATAEEVEYITLPADILEEMRAQLGE